MSRFARFRAWARTHRGSTYFIVMIAVFLALGFLFVSIHAMGWAALMLCAAFATLGILGSPPKDLR